MRREVLAVLAMSAALVLFTSIAVPILLVAGVLFVVRKAWQWCAAPEVDEEPDPEPAQPRPLVVVKPSRWPGPGPEFLGHDTPDDEDDEPVATEEQVDAAIAWILREANPEPPPVIPGNPLMNKPYRALNERAEKEN